MTSPPVLVLNSGSSSVKYRLFGGDEKRGTVERIGEPGGVPDHATALRQIADEVGLADLDLRAVGHRVVHGGTRFRAPTVVDDEVLAALKELSPLAPLHNPGNVTGIEVARALRPDVPHVAVFDTAFHATLPEYAATYALDREVAAEHGIRRYGFHGTSHRYVAARTAELLGRPVTRLNTIVLHLGNGASATAVAGGRSVDTSMGFTPLEGLVMGTRPGDVDPGALVYLAARGLDSTTVDTLLQKRSGLKGLTGDNDLREVLARRAAGDPAATLAFDVYCYRIRKYVGAYHAVLGRLDAIAFTAGVGEHSAEVRAGALDGLAMWGIEVDPARNAGHAPVISPDGARVSVCVVPTDEERAIAEETLALLEES
ncbi:acetate kinase [Virgisporangium aliadipatigenens]|uniref:Acetate kinase n=1 Tax=Virgisporangium aliadipatigenens TaxID=741659 RepID=A0A8J3YJK2_9ACTN|nr:acetate kinase [Virgisporangium aliadipatigenens]GIJ45038.1 acetate kinase [Virgisporangium aliadipatigenens]